MRRRDESFVRFLCRLAGPALGYTSAELEDVIRQSDSLDLVEIILEIEDAIHKRVEDHEVETDHPNENQIGCGEDRRPSCES